jgi:hypothetical protein
MVDIHLGPCLSLFSPKAAAAADERQRPRRVPARLNAPAFADETAGEVAPIRLVAVVHVLAALPCTGGACARGNPAFSHGDVGDGAASDGARPQADLARSPDQGPPSSDQAAGAPTRFVLGSPTQTPLRGSSGGVAHQDRCPAPDQVVVGFRGTVTGNGINDLQVVCGQLTLTRSGTTYVVGTSGAMTLPVRGGGTGTAWTAMCPANHMVAGVEGRSGTWIDVFRVVCAPLTMTADGRSVARGSETLLPAQGDPTGGNAFNDRCSTSQVVSGALIRAGQWVDGFHLYCAAPTPAP